MLFQNLFIIEKNTKYKYFKKFSKNLLNILLNVIFNFYII